MNDYIRQIAENRKHLTFDSAEEKAYFALADYNVNTPDFEKIRSEITHYEYSKGGMAAVYGDENSSGSEDKMQKLSDKKSDVLYRIIQKYITEIFIPETKKTAVRLKAKRGKTKAKDTKFGGKPYMPKGFSYPQINGEPMALICQLNFAEIPHLEGYPESGLLQIFLEIDETAMFEPESYKIFYHTDISGKNTYKNPFKSTKKVENSPKFADYFKEDYFHYFLSRHDYLENSGKLNKLSDLITAVGKSMRVNLTRHIDVLDELTAAYVENRSFNETPFYPIPTTDTAIWKAFRDCTDYLEANPNAEDANPIAELIDDLYFKSEKQPAGTYIDDIFPLSQDKEYKIKAELIEMPFTPDVDGFYELFFEKIIKFFTENPDFVSSENELEILNEFIDIVKNDNSSDRSKLLFDIFPYGEYDFIFEPLSSSSLDKYDKYGACLVGGFPHFTQGDYRPEGYSELLLQIDSFDYSDGYENTVMWGDGGVINFFIKPENLKNADFSDIYIGGDCS
ncbi:MAG: DUF1963 domain-containing protein [Ruminococcus sp.]|jgi:uncharacterized protein YwqG|nr:DUF1963 domain-containing protein [Ruminococcus sp.]